MSKKYKDTDYLGISAQIRAKEPRMLTQARREQMLEARTDEDAARVLIECGYTDLEPLTPTSLATSLRNQRNSVFAEIYSASPNSSLVDVFRIKYDYHNAKAAIKAVATGQDASRLLIDAGRVEAKKLQDSVIAGEYGALPDTLARAIATAVDLLGATRDPQLADFELDRAYYADMLQAADAAGSSFLTGYVRRTIDAANLRSAVRCLRMKKGADFLNRVLVDGGNVPVYTIQNVVLNNGSLVSAFGGAGLQEAAELGDAASHGGRQTEFERACDNAVTAYLRTCRLTPFGDSVVVAYLAAREDEITAARIILSGRMAGVPTASIRERLRDAYV